MTKKDLLIVESPTKARTIERLTNNRLKVLSSRGHIADLPKSKLGIDIERGFEPDYIRIRGKGSVIKQLQQAAKEAKAVYLGCDPDREGEAIAYSVANEVSRADKRIPVKRVLFYEVTKQGIERAFAEPGEVDMNKVASHRARRVLDRLVGYLVSPLLWRIVRGGLSAGRVQTVALRILVEREREIAGFRPVEYWVVKAVFTKDDGTSFEAELHKVAGNDVELGTKNEVDKVAAGCARARFQVTDVQTRTRLRKPLPPFTTATLQQEASQALGFPASKTMRVAQRLFEGVELEDETVGLITYPRTDSVRSADVFVRETRDFIGRTMKPEYLPERARLYKDRKLTQGAHEAIRPTRIDRTPDSVRARLDRDQVRLYDLVYRRFLASQMSDSRYSATEALIGGGEYLFRAQGLVRQFDGFERVYGDAEKDKLLPELKSGERVKLAEFKPEQKFTQPPARYTEATLIKKLEQNGIGRPSTYASIVSTLFDRKYAERKERKLYPTELGMLVNDVLVPRFSNVFEVGFTRNLESQLDQVEEGKEPWQQVVGALYAPLRQDLDEVEANMADIKQELQKELGENCPDCGKPLAERWGRYGKFIACSGYPECKYVKREEQMLEEECPKCGKPMVERTGRYGPFKACSGYPECKYIAKGTKREAKVLDEKCPECGKPMVERTGRYGPFKACSGYPECKYVHKTPRRKVKGA